MFAPALVALNNPDRRRRTRCPECGGSLSYIADGAVSTWIVAVHPRRGQLPRPAIAPASFLSCNRCEWIELLSQGKPQLIGGAS